MCFLPFFSRHSSLLRTVSAQDSQSTIKHGINEKGYFFIVFVLLRAAVWILWGQEEEWRHSNAWHMLTQCVSAGRNSLRKPGCGRHINTTQFLKPSVEFAPFWSYIKYPKEIHYFQNTPPPRHSGQWQIILSLTMAFFNTANELSFSFHGYSMRVN